MSDPKNLAEDCTEVGHWATGDSVFKLSSLEEIDYAISLIKQSYESKL